jgi:chemotaxis protein histidine kinase CheA
MDESKRQPESSAVEQSVGRALRDTLPMVQHTATEFGHAIEDLVSACSSRRVANTMPAMLRAQVAASSLSAMLESLLRLVTLATQPPRMTPAEEIISRAVSLPSVEPAPMPQMPPREIPVPMSSVASAPVETSPPAVIQMPSPAQRVEEEIRAPEEPTPLQRPRFEPEPAAAEAEAPAYEPSPQEAAPEVAEEAASTSAAIETAPAEATPAVQVVEAPAPEAPQEAPAAVFVLETLPAEQQELHRRANRHAKVSMQDIRLLRPKEVALGREHRDICTRLKNDLDKARKEYVRRFQPILEHPIDYFHHWAVEILAEGNAEALGEYPYPTPVNRH